MFSLKRRLAATTMIVLAPLVVLVGCGSQPDRAEVRAGLITQILDDPAGASRQVAEATADCMLDRLYDGVDNSTLDAWAAGDGEITEMEDSIPVLEASRECSRQAADAERAALPVPSMDEVRSGMVRFIPGMYSGVSPDEAQAGEIADCMLEMLGDDIDDDTLRSWARGDSNHSVGLGVAFDAAQRECGETVLAN